MFWYKTGDMCRCLVLSGICSLSSEKLCVGDKLARKTEASAISLPCIVTIKLQEALLSSMRLVRFRHQTQHFLNALQSGLVESQDFPQKFFYCFWWGLQNLSSLGQNLQTSTYIWEICFAVFIYISGLVLFSFLIENMQTYLQSTTTRLEEMRVKRRDAEQTRLKLR